MSDKKNFYVVRKGKEVGIFDAWEKCRANVEGFSGAKYKSFANIDDAKFAFQEGWEKYYGTGNIGKAKKNDLTKMSDGEKIALMKSVPLFKESIAVDAACAGNPGEMEYKGIDLKTGEEIFHKKFKIGTNNIGEFLAIVDGLRFLENNEKSAIYSDSKIAISRINQGKCKTQLKIDKNGNSDFLELLEAIGNAEKWLEEKLKENNIKKQILKRDTEQRGEIPADFGRK